MELKSTITKAEEKYSMIVRGQSSVMKDTTIGERTVAPTPILTHKSLSGFQNCPHLPSPSSVPSPTCVFPSSPTTKTFKF